MKKLYREMGATGYFFTASVILSNILHDLETQGKDMDRWISEVIIDKIQKERKNEKRRNARKSLLKSGG